MPHSHLKRLGVFWILIFSNKGGVEGFPIFKGEGDKKTRIHKTKGLSVRP